MEPENTNPSTDSFPPVPPSIAKTKSNTPLIIILAVLALAGIGFGAYGMWQNFEKDSEISSYKKQLAAKDAQINELTSELEKYKEDEIILSNEEAADLIEAKRKEIGANTWTAKDVKVTKRGDDNRFWVEYIEENTDGGKAPLTSIFHFVDGEWEYSIPGASGFTSDIDKYNWVEL